jgi:NADP-dependent 3-hydroxy acid dehydrogenase YdfG
MRSGLPPAERRRAPLRIAVNNAGIGGEAALIGDYSLEGWRRVIEVNLNAVFYGLKVQLPSMAENGGGSIINMASILGSVGFASSSAFVTAKHACSASPRTPRWSTARRRCAPTRSGRASSTPRSSTRMWMPRRQACARPPRHPGGGLGAGLLPRLGCRVVHLRQLPPGGWRVCGVVVRRG